MMIVRFRQRYGPYSGGERAGFSDEEARRLLADGFAESETPLLRPERIRRSEPVVKPVQVMRSEPVAQPERVLRSEPVVKPEPIIAQTKGIGITVHGGTCPHCKRTYVRLAQHIAKRHPGLTG